MDERMSNITRLSRLVLFIVLIFSSSHESTIAADGKSMSASDFTKVEQASPKWIQIACRLRFHADAGFASELESALSLALSKRPDLVLAELNEQYVEGVCSAPFLIDYPDFEAGLKILMQTKSGLLKLKSDTLAKKKKMCLTQVDEQINKMQDERFDNKQNQLPSDKMRR
jgi:hypothetical protein